MDTNIDKSEPAGDCESGQVVEVDEREKISDADAAYHAVVLAEQDKIRQIDAMMQQMAQDRVAAAGAVQSWMGHLAKKYALLQGDNVDTDGYINRAG